MTLTLRNTQHLESKRYATFIHTYPTLTPVRTRLKIPRTAKNKKKEWRIKINNTQGTFNQNFNNYYVSFKCVSVLFAELEKPFHPGQRYVSYVSITLRYRKLLLCTQVAQITICVLKQNVSLCRSGRKRCSEEQFQFKVDKAINMFSSHPTNLESLSVFIFSMNKLFLLTLHILCRYCSPGYNT